MKDDLEQLAKIMESKNKIDEKVSAIIERPALRGHTGEYIASKIFDIKLEYSASCKAIDGAFRTGTHAGKTVNIKWYGMLENILDVSKDNGPNFYLVLTGPKSVSLSSRGATRPWVISYVFLFESTQLAKDLKYVKKGIATSVKNRLWERAEIYPKDTNTPLTLTQEQRRLLGLFGDN